MLDRADIVKIPHPNVCRKSQNSETSWLFMLNQGNTEHYTVAINVCFELCFGVVIYGDLLKLCRVLKFQIYLISFAFIHSQRKCYDYLLLKSEVTKKYGYNDLHLHHNFNNIFIWLQHTYLVALELLANSVWKSCNIFIWLH